MGAKQGIFIKGEGFLLDIPVMLRNKGEGFQKGRFSIKTLLMFPDFGSTKLSSMEFLAEIHSSGNTHLIFPDLDQTRIRYGNTP